VGTPAPTGDRRASCPSGELARGVAATAATPRIAYERRRVDPQKNAHQRRVPDSGRICIKPETVVPAGRRVDNSGSRTSAGSRRSAGVGEVVTDEIGTRRGNPPRPCRARTRNRRRRSAPSRGIGIVHQLHAEPGGLRQCGLVVKQKPVAEGALAVATGTRAVNSVPNRVTRSGLFEYIR
jgi:hypothetical protein